MKRHIRWAVSFMSHSKGNLEQMLRDLLMKREGGTWHPCLRVFGGQVPASQKHDLSIDTTTGCHKIPFEEQFKISRCALNRQGKAHDAIEERMDNPLTKLFWENILRYKSEEIPRKIKCRRLVGHVLAVFSFGSENWSWTVQTLERSKGWETKTMLRLFRFINKKKKHGSTIVQGHAERPAFLYDVIAESMLRPTGWVCDERTNAAIDAL